MAASGTRNTTTFFLMSKETPFTLCFERSFVIAVASGEAFFEVRALPLRVAIASRSSSTVVSASFFVPSSTGKRSVAKSMGVRPFSGPPFLVSTKVMAASSREPP